MERPFNYEFLASLREHTDFAAGIIWQDMENEIRFWLDDIHTKLETEEEPRDIHRLQGNAEACRNFLQLPQSIISMLRAITEEKENG